MVIVFLQIEFLDSVKQRMVGTHELQHSTTHVYYTYTKHIMLYTTQHKSHIKYKAILHNISISHNKSKAIFTHNYTTIITTKPAWTAHN